MTTGRAGGAPRPLQPSSNLSRVTGVYPARASHCIWAANALAVTVYLANEAAGAGVTWWYMRIGVGRRPGVPVTPTSSAGPAHRREGAGTPVARALAGGQS